MSRSERLSLQGRGRANIKRNNPQEQTATFHNDRIRVLTGDITSQDVHAIVNAANSTLLGGAGVDGAIHRVGGPQILEECREIRRTKFPQGLPTGEAVITSGGLLPARYVIHTVGPIYGRDPGNEAELLRNCYQNSIRLAAEHGLTSLAFPSISTGAYGYPKTEAASVSSRAVAEALLQYDSVSEVRLVFFSQADMKTFLQNHEFEVRE